MALLLIQKEFAVFSRHDQKRCVIISSTELSRWQTGVILKVDTFDDYALA